MSDLKQTDLSKRLREIATAFESSGDYHKTMNAAADEIERYYTGMLNWKATAEAKDADFRKTYRKPEATAPAQDLSAAILALPEAAPAEIAKKGIFAYYWESGFREARANAAALASSASALSAGDRVDAELARADKSPVKITNQELAAFHRFCDCCEDFDSGGHDVEKSMMSQLVRIGLVRPAGPGRHETTKFGDWLRDSAIDAAILQSQKGGSHD